MEHGRILERGNFRELIERDGKFAEMWRLQQEEDSKHSEGIRAA